MDELDGIVVDAVVEHVLQPERLRSLLQAWIDRSDEAQVDRRERLKVLRNRQTMLDGESANVIKLVRTGICSAEDPQIATELGNIVARRRLSPPILSDCSASSPTARVR